MSGSFSHQWTAIDWMRCSTQTHLMALAIRQVTSEQPPRPHKSLGGRQSVAVMSLSWVCHPA